MVDTVSVLAQSNPTINTLTTIYTVPANTATTISSFVVCNQSGSNANFNLSIAVAGAADTPAQYLYYNLFLDANDTFIATIGATLAATDQIRVFTNNASMSFNVFGVQLTGSY